MAYREAVALVIAMSLGGPAARAASRSLALAVGESEVVRFPAGTDLAVSRRGVVDLFHAGDGSWEITALRAGFAVIDGRDAVTGEARPPRVFVTVASADERPSFGEHLDLPAWLCKPRGVRCDKAAGIVSGRVDDPLWLQRAADFCAHANACLFAVDLSEKGQAGRRGRYRLAAKIFLVEDGAAEELGFDGDARVAFSAPAGKADVTLLSRLRALASVHQAEILGEPLFRMTPGEEVQLVSGGEFQVQGRSTGSGNDRDGTTWKQHGLALKLRLTPLAAGRARLTYDLSLKSPTASRTALTVNSLHSEVDLPVGSPMLVGILDLEARLDDSQDVPPLASIPLIGPLFHGQGHQATKSRLGFWLHLAEDADDALTGPWTKAGPP